MFVGPVNSARTHKQCTGPTGRFVPHVKPTSSKKEEKKEEGENVKEKNAT